LALTQQLTATLMPESKESSGGSENLAITRRLQIFEKSEISLMNKIPSTNVDSSLCQMTCF
jgi:hypothetical protein